MLIFCEVCFRVPKQVGVLLLASCRHMFCRRCASSTTSCAVCQQQCRIIELKKETLPPHLKEYFSPVTDLLDKANKVAQFQQEKIDAFIAGKAQIFEKVEVKKKNNLKLKGHYDGLKKAIEEEVALIRKFREKRKSPGLMKAPLVSPTYIQSEMETLRISDPSKNTPPYQQPSQNMKRSRGTGSDSSRESQRRTAPLSQGSNCGPMDRKRATPPSGARQSVSPIETFKKPADLAMTARAGIYQETVRNINSAMQRTAESVVRVSKRGSDIERARNVHF